MIGTADAEAEARKDAERAVLQAKAVSVMEAERIALGEPAHDHKRRADEKLWHESKRSTSRKSVAGFPDLLATWDWDRNEADPATVRGSSREGASWICRAHEGDPVPHCIAGRRRSRSAPTAPTAARRA